MSSVGPHSHGACSPVTHYRGRFAPSPTGPLHFGSLLAALASFCDAKVAGGEWLLRIEDVDGPRSRDDAACDILATLERYGFEWDGAVVRQSDRIPRYEAALEHLRAMTAVYPCTCTRRELDLVPIGASGERVYPGFCRAGVADNRGHRGRHAWRVRVTDEIIAFIDRVQGPQAEALGRDVGDFVVRRTDGYFAYQLAVVVDDAAQGVTDVVRGADLLASTSRQIYLQRLLGVATPAYLHIPIAIDSAGEKISKQTCAPPLPPSPLAALLAAWRWLDQPAFESLPANVTEFWSLARRSWSPQRLPPVPMLPAPVRFAAAERAVVGTRARV
ncbi:MAG: tRNA glutamyl-Q(34) synthetase GluQRS [Casimicrobiaceae bacterium]